MLSSASRHELEDIGSLLRSLVSGFDNIYRVAPTTLGGTRGFLEVQIILVADIAPDDGNAIFRRVQEQGLGLASEGIFTVLSGFGYPMLPISETGHPWNQMLKALSTGAHLREFIEAGHQISIAPVPR